MVPFLRTALILLSLPGCQLVFPDTTTPRRMARVLGAAEFDVSVETPWEAQLPGRDVERDEALAFAVREVLVGMTAEQRLPILASLAPAQSFIERNDDGAPLPTATVVQAQPVGVLPVLAIVGLAAAHSEAWSRRPIAPVDFVPSVPLLATVLRELTSRLGDEQLAVAALLFGTDIERRIEKTSRPPSLLRVSGWLNARRRLLFSNVKEAMTLAELYALSWPVSPRARLTSAFGYRLHPIYGSLQLHKGVDIAVPNGTEIRAPSGATVRRAKEDSRNGKWIELDHGNGISTVFCHASELKLEKGAKVSPGDVIALSGESGVATGPHLHYQLQLARQAVDPLRFRASAAQALFEAPMTPAAVGAVD